ncbi:hypothetical protein BHM03_00052656, partial [Ensete ventricosum]
IGYWEGDAYPESPSPWSPGRHRRIFYSVPLPPRRAPVLDPRSTPIASAPLRLPDRLDRPLDRCSGETERFFLRIPPLQLVGR